MFIEMNEFIVLQQLASKPLWSQCWGNMHYKIDLASDRGQVGSNAVAYNVSITNASFRASVIVAQSQCSYCV